MKASPPTAQLLGYDPELLKSLPRRYRERLDSLASLWLVSCVLLGLPMGLATWLVEHSLFLAFVVSLSTSTLVLNLLRLIHSGSGTAPELPLRKGYRPSLTPMFLLLGLALVMSQPAQLLHASESVRNAVAEHRAELLASHKQALSELGGTGEDTFTQEIEECEFVVLRLSLIWNTPISALLFTILYVGLAMLPAAMGRSSYLKALRAYERVRYRAATRRIAQLEALTRRDVAAALQAFPTYRPPWPFAPAAPLTLADAKGARQ